MPPHAQQSVPESAVCHRLRFVLNALVDYEPAFMGRLSDFSAA